MPAPHDALATPRAVRTTGPRRLRRLLVSVTAVVTALTTVGALAETGAAQAAPPSSTPDLGPNVLVFDPTMSQADIQAKVNAISTLQVNNEMGEARFALLFKPGVYGSEADPLIFQVGFYTEVAGLGQNPGDVTIHGSVNVYNQCTPASGCIALDNFWRSLSNLTVDIAGGSGCQTDSEFWAVSQAAPLRRVNIINGQTSFMDYCSAGPQYASGGFMADSSVPGVLVSGSQQQWLTETSNVGTWTNGVWNQVFAGTTGAPATDFQDGVKGSGQNYTTLATDPVSRDKPYFYFDATGNENVFVPSATANAAGTTWASGSTPGTSIPINRFFVAQPGDTIEKINNALSHGQNLLLTPGIYRFDDPIKVQRRDQVVLGLGFATLIPTDGNAAIKVADVPGVKLAGLLIDAGTEKSQSLVQVGTGDTQHQSAKQRAKLSDPTDPTTLSDVFLRIGGDIAGKAETALTVNSDNVLLDDIWDWRADHGNAGTVGWTINTANQGLVVNGDNVTATGLFVEHFQKYDVTWNGNGGKVVFFQNEMPYDAPSQAAWQHNGVNGFAAIHVDKHVTSFQGWGLGSYIFTNVVPTLHSESGFEVPVTPGVQLHDVLTISLNAAGTIDHVVNEEGTAVTPTVQGPAQLVSAP
ncbi:hypothetical protein acdb102_32960 [Acidothermaceae bacterium B102]|nr:hypothetical protein acdb102_32960 [Acidothermaceae bacterium B102]